MYCRADGGACQARNTVCITHILCLALTTPLRVDMISPCMKLEPIYKTIGGIIRQRRRRLELPQVELARRLGISRATLANIETGRQRVLVHHVYALAEALDIKPSDLLPQVNKTGSISEWAQFSLPNDLKPQQKEQIALIIGPMNQTTSKPKEKTDAKFAKTLRRSAR
jgi:transcriptional regulator with XRE-family HTH domain